MKVILTEEQIKKILCGGFINEDPETEPAQQANTEGSWSAVSQQANAEDPVTMIQTANRNMNGIFSKLSGNNSSYWQAEDPMPNGPMAYADQNRQEYNNSIGINQTWPSIARRTFEEYKTAFNDQYSQKSENGGPRADCSGFVYSALKNAGYNVGNGNTDDMIDKNGFTNAISRGFRRTEWNNTGTAAQQHLPAGTILAFKKGENNKKFGHTLILGDNGESYDYGKNKHTMKSPNLRLRYSTAWVPIV